MSNDTKQVKTYIEYIFGIREWQDDFDDIFKALDKTDIEMEFNSVMVMNDRSPRSGEYSYQTSILREGVIRSDRTVIKKAIELGIRLDTLIVSSIKNKNLILAETLYDEDAEHLIKINKHSDILLMLINELNEGSGLSAYVLAKKQLDYIEFVNRLIKDNASLVSVRLNIDAMVSGIIKDMCLSHRDNQLHLAGPEKETKFNF